MQTGSPPSPRRRLVAAACLALLLACTSASRPEPQPSDSATDDAEAVLQSREALGDPMVALGEAALELVDAVDQVRYEVARGPAMRRALDAVPPAADALRSAADTAARAAGEARVPAAAAIVDAAAAYSEAAADGARAETRYLRRLQRVDARLLAIAAQWDRPGSQSEIRARLAAAAEEVIKVRRRARRLRPSPAGCGQLRANRIAWAKTVRSRTLRLQDRADSAGGSEFDELRAAYRRLPLGVEPRTEDQRERGCWRDRSAVAAAAERVRADVEALQEALQ